MDKKDTNALTFGIVCAGGYFVVAMIAGLYEDLYRMYKLRKLEKKRKKIIDKINVSIAMYGEDARHAWKNAGHEVGLDEAKLREWGINI